MLNLNSSNESLLSPSTSLAAIQSSNWENRIIENKVLLVHYLNWVTLVHPIAFLDISLSYVI